MRVGTEEAAASHAGSTRRDEAASSLRGLLQEQLKGRSRSVTANETQQEALANQSLWRNGGNETRNRRTEAQLASAPLFSTSISWLSQAIFCARAFLIATQNSVVTYGPQDAYTSL